MSSLTNRIQRLEKHNRKALPKDGYTVEDWLAGSPHPDPEQQAIMDERRKQAAETMALFAE